MALTVTTTSPSAASNPAVAVIVQNAWRDALVGHSSGAWTLVEEFDSASAAIHWVVIKNTTAISGAGADFFVVIARRISDGELGVFVGESYSTSGKVMSSPAPLFASGTTAVNANGTYSTTTFTLGNGFPGSYGEPRMSPQGYNGAPLSSTLKQTCHVTEKYAILTHYLGSGTGMSTAVMVGNFADSLMQAPAVDQPIIGSVDMILSGMAGALTRHAVEVAMNTMKYAYQIYGPTSSNFQTLGTNIPAVICGNYFGGDRYQADRVAACEVLLLMGSALQSTSATKASIAGVLRGKFRGIRYGAVPGAGVPGDTVVVDGKRHMIMQKTNVLLAGDVSGPQVGLLMDTGVAA